MARQFLVLVAIAVAVACAQATAEGESSFCKWGGFELKQGEVVLSANMEGLCKRCRCELPPRVACDEEALPCEVFPAGATIPEPETLPAVAAEIPVSVPEVKFRKTRSPDGKKKNTCSEKQCVTACVMRNGSPECV